MPRNLHSKLASAAVHQMMCLAIRRAPSKQPHPYTTCLVPRCCTPWAEVSSKPSLLGLRDPQDFAPVVRVLKEFQLVLPALGKFHTCAEGLNRTSETTFGYKLFGEDVRNRDEVVESE